MQHYAITISQSLKPKKVTKETLDATLAHIAKKAKSFALTEKVYELDSKGRLHMHATGLMPKHQWIPKLMRYGFSIRVVKLKKPLDVEKWSSYIHKETGKEDSPYFNILQQRIIDQHMFNTHNFFT